MILTAVILRVEGQGGRNLVGLAVLGVFVLISNYFDRSSGASRMNCWWPGACG